MNDGLKQGIRNFKFRYTGDENVDCSDIARITCALYVEGIIWEQEYDIEISKYPGDKMLAAYFSSDYSKLTAEEKQKDMLHLLLAWWRNSSTRQINSQIYIYLVLISYQTKNHAMRASLPSNGIKCVEHLNFLQKCSCIHFVIQVSTICLKVE